MSDADTVNDNYYLKFIVWPANNKISEGACRCSCGCMSKHIEAFPVSNYIYHQELPSFPVGGHNSKVYMHKCI